jgi:branched-chain amino acid aminotransferase
MNTLDCPAWLNGQHCQVKDLNFSILDLGLIHCDASYDVACSIDRKIFLLDQHITRFIRSCQGLRLSLGLSKEKIKDIIVDLCKRADQDSLLIWMGITRGIPSTGNPRDLTSTTPNVFFYVKPYYDFGKSDKPITLCLSKTVRTPNESINQNYKNWSWIDLTSAQWEAADRGYDSAVLLSTDNFITEGPGFGVWGIHNNTVFSPYNNCLPSVTIRALEYLCYENNIPFMNTDITAEELSEFDFLGIASTSGGIKAVKQFESKVYSEHPLYTRLIALMNEARKNESWTTDY